MTALNNLKVKSQQSSAVFIYLPNIFYLIEVNYSKNYFRNYITCRYDTFFEIVNLFVTVF